MYSWNWTSFCGHGEQFTEWSGHDFGHCFEQIGILAPSYAILATISAYHFGRKRTNIRGSVVYVSWTWFLLLRFVAVLALLCSPVLQIVLTLFVEHVRPSFSDALVASLSAVGWFFHALYVWNVRYLHSSSLRGPPSTIVAVFIVIASNAAHLHTVIIMHISGSVHKSETEKITTFVCAGLCAVYVISIIPCKRRIYHTGVDSNHAINSSGGESEPIVWDREHTYNTYSHIAEPVVAEKGVGCLSWLSFYWVSQLMSKGAERQIQSVNDLFLLPARLETEMLEGIFKSTISSKGKDLNADSSHLNDESLSRPSEYGRSWDSQTSIPTVDIISSINYQEDAQTYQSISNAYAERVHNKNSRSNNICRTDKHPVKLNLFKALSSTFGREYFCLGILKLLADCFGFAGPIILNLLVTFVESDVSQDSYKGYVFASALFLSTLLATLCSTQFSYNVQVVAYKVRCALITTVYRKSLQANAVTQATFTPGEIVNFMSTDVDRILNFCPSFHAFWSLPFQVGVSLFLLYQQVGLAFLAGLAFAVLLVPVNRKIAVKIGELSKKMMKHKDERVKLMNELLYGIRVVKFYSWEQHFTDCIKNARENELKCLKGRKYLDALCVFFWATTPVLISILTFTTYVLIGHQLTAAKVFTSLSLFLMLIGPLNAFPWVINGLVESWVSLKRVEKYVNLKDAQPTSYYSNLSDLGSESIIEMKNASFTWQECENVQQTQRMGSNMADGQSSSEEDTVSQNSSGSENIGGSQDLVDISFKLVKGHLLGVIGKVGSGKSSLLSAIVGEMNRTGGTIEVSDLIKEEGFALVAQEPWIQHASIRDNILFGQPFNRHRYDKVLEACALADDLQMMPAGDKTEVGENGITLSGGQRARVTLARAVYQDKGIYLLDDPLSAVDAHVAQHIYTHCIMGLLKNKTRILCTHHVQFLSSADWILLMEQGSIAQSGPPEEIITNVHLMEATRQETRQKDVKEGGRTGNEEDEEEELVDDLTQEEDRQTGVIKTDVYKAYWLAVGACLTPWVLVSLFFMQASRNLSDWWLSYWVSHSHSSNSSSKTVAEVSSLFTSKIFSELSTNANSSSDNLRFYLGIYGGLAGANSLFTLIRAFLFAYGGICAATVVHKRLLSAVIKAPISFFDSTPIGRILNRFSSDLYSVDDSLPFILNIFLAQAYGILGTLVVTCYGLPWFLVCLIPMAAFYYKIQLYYRHTSRELKRLSSVTLSPIYAHFSETITGLSTIKAMKHMERFCEENRRCLDVNQRCQYATQLSARWLDFRLSMLGVAMVACISFIAVVQHQLSTIDAGLVGLAISYSLSVTNLLGGVVMSFTETEKEFVSLERCQHYITETPSERWDGALFSPTVWPSEGVIEFDSVSLRYREALTYALTRVSFKTRPGEKVGVVGRTGAGKSSLFLTLFRLVELTEGRILVDDVDISRLDLTDIRSKFAIIPQDPFLFSGTVRQNLDPTSSHSDTDLWSTLERCHMRACLEQMGGLESTVSHRGREFSVGQRQLICLARAMLTKAKVLCIDEATASVDMETDNLIQSTIRHEFRESTVLTIAHRVNTVLDSHRVLVLREGAVAEFAPPRDLLEDSSSLFYCMVYGNS
ncbi:multidrug resistance-associated protein 7-like [Plakobranchus ocellatus]|uniref:ABC-type xenobiotic transporter n=1 Tax=Plakobranchus ocellatus TaxID=259542 RepID=A0AAV3Y2I6_9GAST|nr:multidrug resistance-associated protein 7-like [Plakobranchus ocellatus]